MALVALIGTPASPQDYQDPAACDTITPLTWASLVVTFITVQLSWWIFELSLLCEKKANPDSEEGGKEGYRFFLHAVTWTCIRINAPGSTALLSRTRAADTGEYARVYYLSVQQRTFPSRFWVGQPWGWVQVAKNQEPGWLRKFGSAKFKTTCPQAGWPLVRIDLCPGDLEA